MTILKYILLIPLAALAILIPIVIALIKFENQLPLGALLKSRLIRYPQLITAINMNQPGDSRFEYLSPASRSISVVVAAVEGINPNPSFESWVSQMVDETTGKSVSYPEILSLPRKEVYTSEDLNQIRDTLRRQADEPSLYVIYLTTHADHRSYAGITQHRDTIFLFKNAMYDLTAKEQDIANLEHSTLLHEWGHLLGLDHNDFDNCVMSGTVEVSDSSPFVVNNIPTRFCWNELYELNAIRQRVK